MNAQDLTQYRRREVGTSTTKAERSLGKQRMLVRDPKSAPAYQPPREGLTDRALLSLDSDSLTIYHVDGFVGKLTHHKCLSTELSLAGMGFVVFFTYPSLEAGTASLAVGHPLTQYTTGTFNAGCPGLLFRCDEKLLLVVIFGYAVVDGMEKVRLGDIFGVTKGAHHPRRVGHTSMGRAGKRK